MHLPRQIILLKIVAFFAGFAGCGLMTQLQASEYAAAQLIGHLPGRMVSESSGLAASPTDQDVLWTHNDSGDKPRLFRFHLGTHELQEFHVVGAKAVDWEDMASFTRGDDSFCLIADTGDNRHSRGVYQLYLVSEQPTEPGCLQVVQTVNFRYQDGAQDCEAVAFDSVGNEVILITKDWKLTCTVHRLSWPTVDTKETVVATPIATIKVAGVTGLDISPDGHRAVVLSYGPAYEFARESGESWKSAFARSGLPIELPARRQGEAVCYGADGRTLFLTSEKLPCPLFKITTANTVDSAVGEN